MLTGAGFGNHSGLARAFSQEYLTEDIVDLMRTGVVQVFTLEIDTRAAQILGHPPGKIQQGGSTCVILQQAV